MTRLRPPPHCNTPASEAETDPAPLPPPAPSGRWQHLIDGYETRARWRAFCERMVRLNGAPPTEEVGEVAPADPSRSAE